jgi:iron complex outermembrane receptor protein
VIAGFWITRLARGVAAAVLVMVALGALAAPATQQAAPADDNPAPGWQRRLAQVESHFRAARADDSFLRASIESQLAALRTEIERWLLGHSPAQAWGQPWIAPAAPVTCFEDLAVEIGSIRAAIGRIAAGFAGGDGAFFLGRLEVAVTAEAVRSPTTEIAPIGAAVIESKQIVAHDRVALSGALALAPGVSFSRIGSRNETTVFVRGFDLRQVPVFIDGVPVYTPYDGYADLERFTTFDVAELQVSKGFTSVVHGANALGGAINVVSRLPAARFEGAGGASVGSGRMRSGFINAGARGATWYAQGGGSFLIADRMPISGAFVPVKTEDGGARENSFRRDARFNLKLGLMTGGTGEYAISYVGQRGRKGNPPYAGTDPSVRVRYWKWPHWDKDSVYFVSRTSLGRAGYLRGRAYHDIYDNLLYSYDDATYTTQFKGSSFRSPYHDSTTGGSVEWGRSIAGHHALRAAAHLKKDHHEEGNVGEPVREQEGWIASVGIESTVALSPRISLVTGLGFDRQTTSVAQGLERGVVVELPRGTTSGLNPQAGVFWAVPSGMVRVTVSRKTRLPSMKDRFSYKLGTAVPNPLLEPERSTTFETGFQGAVGRRTTVQVSAFFNRLAGLIQLVPLGPNLSQQQNVARASSAGFEVDVRHRVTDALEISGNYTFLDRENLSRPGVPLVDTPRHEGLVTLMVGPSWRLRGMVSVDVESGRVTLNDGGRYLNVPAFAVVHAKVGIEVTRRAGVDLSVSNLGDRNYWIADGYPEAGRIVRLALSVRF